MMLSNNNMR